MPSAISLERRGSTALLTLCRPPANAMNRELLSELQAALVELRDSEARALVITGSGRIFSAGLDLFELVRYSPAEADDIARRFDDAVTAAFALELPVVAALNGHAMAGGAVLAASCDFRIAGGEHVRLGLPGILVGIPYPTSALEILRTAWAGPHLSELLYRGTTYPAPAALARHFLDEVVAPDALVARALALADELGSRPRLAFATTKRRLRSEALARIRAARGPTAEGADPAWSAWRTPEVQQAIAKYMAALAEKSAR